MTYEESDAGRQLTLNDKGHDISTSAVNTGEDHLVRFHHNDSDMSFSPITAHCARNDKVEVLEKDTFLTTQSNKSKV